MPSVYNKIILSDQSQFAYPAYPVKIATLTMAHHLTMPGSSFLMQTKVKK